jgi:hypothetical protein
MSPCLFMENKMRDLPQTMAMQQLQGSGAEQMSELMDEVELKWLQSTCDRLQPIRDADHADVIPVSRHDLTMLLQAARVVFAALAPEQDKGCALQDRIAALSIARAYLVEEAESGSVWSSLGNAKAVAAIDAALAPEQDK